MPFEQGDRVLWPGYEFRNEPDRLGNVTKVYFGTPSMNVQTLSNRMYEVTFDDGKVERGFLDNGRLQKVFQEPG